MSNWWDAAPLAPAQPAPAPAGNWWDSAPLATPAPAPVGAAVGAPSGVYGDPMGGTIADPSTYGPRPKTVTGNILPFRRDEAGNVTFDSNVGVLGGLKRAFNLPGEVYRGEVDPMSDEGLGRALEMAGTITPMAPGLRMGAPALVPQAAKVSPPTKEALKAAGSAGYDQARDMGVVYSSDSVKAIADAMVQRLESKGALRGEAKGTYEVLDRLSNPPPGSTAPMEGVISARKAFGRVGQKFSEPTDQFASQQATRALDDFIANPPPVAVLSGPAREAGEVYQQANANYAAAKRAERLNEARYSAEMGASSSNSGSNVGNATRQKLRPFLTDPAKGAGFSEAELAAAEGVVTGDKPTNAVRRIANFLGGGGGLGALTASGMGAGAGAAIAGPVGAAVGSAVPPAIGIIAKAIENKMTSKAIKNVDEMIRARSPLNNQMQANPPMAQAGVDKYEALIRALMQAQAQPAQ